MADWKDILHEHDEQLSEEELLRYLDDKTSEEERCSIEQRMNNNPFEADALQGLSQVQDKDKLQKQVNQLNLKLQQLTNRKPRKEKRKINIFQWVILAILILLFICIIGYVIISMQNKSGEHTQLLHLASHC